MGRVYVGVDVGTGSARAGVFTASGDLLGAARHPIEIWREPGHIVEQSSDDIWAACGRAVRGAIAEARITRDAVAGIGFDATCSLVALDAAGRPVSVSPSGQARRNVMVWMDHRAVDEARSIDRTGHDVLRYSGGSISPEMEMPKLLWLKHHMPRSFEAAAHFFDLVDFLTWRATGSTARSACAVTCKWNYLPGEGGWNTDFLQTIGLEALAENDAARIGAAIVAPATSLAAGLSEPAARVLGLAAGTPVASGLLDAHAGGVATLGGRTIDGAPGDPTRRFAYVTGTSACIMANTAGPRFIDGIWGPYCAGMLPDLWLSEGGQTTAGAGIDHLARSHAAYPRAAAEAAEAGLGLYQFLEQALVRRAGSLQDAAYLTRDLHVVPNFLGSRSPEADPDARAVILGLSLDGTIDGLARRYVAGVCGLSYGLADVIDAMRGGGITCEAIVASGGASRSQLVRQVLADTTGLPVVLPRTREPVLLGAAILAAVAAGTYDGIAAAAAAMARDAETTAPTPPAIRAFHDAKRAVYRMLRRLDNDARSRMAGPERPAQAGDGAPENGSDQPGQTN